MTAEEFNNVYTLCQFLPGPNIVNLTAVFGSRMRGPTGAMAAWAGFLVVPFCVMLVAGILYERYGDVEAVRRVLAGIAPAAAGLLIATAAKMAVPMFRSFGPAPFVLLATAAAIGLMRWPLLLVLIVMKADGDILVTLAVQFAMMSLLAFGGANAVVPEMHRQAVELRGWMTEREFTDMFAMSQAAPGPNVMLVTLIGYHVAGVAGALITTLAMCGPTAVLAHFLGRTWDLFKDAPWRVAVQAGVVPISVGLVGASAIVLTQAADRSWVAAVITVATAVTAFWSRWNPLWLIGVAGLAGLTGLV
jgi:chromate transporter